MTNAYSDLLQTIEEFTKTYLSKINMASGRRTAEVHVASKNEPMVATVDWRTKGIVTGVKNQVS